MWMTFSAIKPKPPSKAYKAEKSSFWKTCAVGTPKPKAAHQKHNPKPSWYRILAPLADLFVSDAFSAAHRGHVSMVGFTAVLPSAAGRIMQRELTSLSKALEKPEHPCVYVMGGAKADDSLEISKYVLGNGIADYVLVGGVTSQLFLAAKGVNLGKTSDGLS